MRPVQTRYRINGVQLLSARRSSPDIGDQFVGHVSRNIIYSEYQQKIDKFINKMFVLMTIQSVSADHRKPHIVEVGNESTIIHKPADVHISSTYTELLVNHPDLIVQQAPILIHRPKAVLAPKPHLKQPPLVQQDTRIHHEHQIKRKYRKPKLPITRIRPHPKPSHIPISPIVESLPKAPIQTLPEAPIHEPILTDPIQPDSQDPELPSNTEPVPIPYPEIPNHEVSIPETPIPIPEIPVPHPDTPETSIPAIPPPDAQHENAIRQEELDDQFLRELQSKRPAWEHKGPIPPGEIIEFNENPQNEYVVDESQLDPSRLYLKAVYDHKSEGETD